MSSPLPAVALGSQSLVASGVGYNTLTGACGAAAATSYTPPPLPPLSQTVTYAMKQVSSLAELHRDVDLSASVRPHGDGAPSDIRAQFTERATVHDYHAYLLVRVAVVAETNVLKNPTVTAGAKASLSAADVTAEQVLAHFGDSFIGETTRGGELTALVEIVTATAAEREAASQSIAASEGTSDDGTSIATTLSALRGQFPLSILCLRAGGSESRPFAVDTPDADGLIAAVSAFADAVEVPGASVLFRAVPQPLTAASGYPRTAPAPDLGEQRRALDSLFEALLYVDGQRANWEYVKEHAAQFAAGASPDENLTALDALRRRIHGKIEAIRAHPFAVLPAAEDPTTPEYARHAAPARRTGVSSEA